MHRRLQFGMCENPASDRRHGSRPAVSASSNARQNEFQSDEEACPDNTARIYETFQLPLGNASIRATGEKEESSGRLLTVQEVASLLHVPVSWVYGRMRKRSLERLPAYKLGKYWRFREHEILHWVQRQRAEWCND
jgi:excisionase family DNA binding protein